MSGVCTGPVFNPGARPPVGERWISEIKFDGFRLVARRAQGQVRLFTKQGYDYSRRYPLIVEALRRLRVSSIVVDGEAVCFGEDGSHDFNALWDNSRDETVTLCAFDLLELNGEDWRDKPLIERKRRLRRLLTKDRDGLRYVEHLRIEPATIFEHVCNLGLEGIVCKRVDLPYESGPSKRWIKVKNREHPSILRVREALERERMREAARRRR